ncbi:ketopantoate reductase family protein [Halalkalibaculum sp. DA3122]|uniref:ketopantoate reductase family protein n=1 Tax=unclassified Halalkalibaculum TaxID=2964617 RepID=UPI003754292D
MEYKKIMVMGAGAVGAYFGARIQQSSNAEVAFIARGAHLEAIQTHGIRVESPEGDARVKVDAFESPTEAGTPDLVLFTVKSYDTEAAIEDLKPVVSEHTQILTIQNGIENYEKLRQAFGSDRVIQGFCRIGASITEPGVIRHISLGSVVVGEPDGSRTDRLQALEGLFENTHIQFTISDDIWHEVWVKFTWNSIFNMMTAVGEVTVDKLFVEPESEQLCYNLFDEIRQVAKREGIELNEQDRERIIEQSRALEGFTTSTYNDRKSGKKLEYEAFTGAIVRLAQKHEVAVPCNQTMYAFLKLIT